VNKRETLPFLGFGGDPTSHSSPTPGRLERTTVNSRPNDGHQPLGGFMHRVTQVSAQNLANDDPTEKPGPLSNPATAICRRLGGEKAHEPSPEVDVWTDRGNRLESSAVRLRQRIMIRGGAQWTVHSPLMLFNEVIIRKGCRAGVFLIDLWLIWGAEADDVNPIELSVAGGAKRAGSIAAPVGEHNLGRGHSTNFLWICDLINRTMCDR